MPADAPNDPIPLTRGSSQRPDIPDHELLRCIGAGSYGEVWLARSTLGRLRAVKIIRRAAFQEVGPFERELKGLMAFEPVSRSHSGFVPILQIGRAPDGQAFYYVMELADPLPGTAAGEGDDYQPQTLRAWQRARGKMAPNECLLAVTALAEALNALHRAGLVHRDVKPANVIFLAGQARLADIGLVAPMQDARSFVGTAGFIPPEGPGTPAADLYALGKILYELTTNLDREAFPSLPDGWNHWPDRNERDELVEVFNRACDPDPGRRYASAEAMLADLRRLEGGASLRRRRLRLTRLRWALLLLPCLLAVGVTGLAWRNEWRGFGSPWQRHVRSHPQVASWENARLGQGDSNSRDTELFITQADKVHTLTAAGETLRSWSFPQAATRDRTLALLTDVDGDSQVEKIITWANGTNVVIEVVRLNGQTSARFNLPGQSHVNEVGATNYASQPFVMAAVKLPGEPHPWLLGGMITGHIGRYGHDQWRSLAALEPATGRMRWELPITSSPTGWIAHTNREGSWELFLGTYAPANGVRTPDGARDDQSYLWRISATGELLARIPMGDRYTGVRLAEFGTHAGGQWSALLWTFMESDFRRREGAPSAGLLRRIDGAATELARWAGPHPLEDARVVRWSPGSPAEVALLDTEGYLRLLDADLRELRSLRLTDQPHDRVQGQLVEVCDLDEDGIAELILVCTSQSFGTPRSLSPDIGPLNHGRYHENRLLVLDPKLRVKSRYRLPAGLANPPRAAVHDLDGDGSLEVLVLSRELTMLAWRSWWKRVFPWAH